MRAGGLRKFLDTRKGSPEKSRGAPKICILQNQQEREEGLLKNITASGGAAKMQASSFNIFIPPLVILNELSLTSLEPCLSTLNLENIFDVYFCLFNTSAESCIASENYNVELLSVRLDKNVCSIGEAITHFESHTTFIPSSCLGQKYHTNVLLVTQILLSILSN